MARRKTVEPVPDTPQAETAEVSAKKLYNELVTGRTYALDIARRCAELTIPSLLPPEGTNNNTRIPSPYQSLCAYGVNNLSAKTLMALYPPGNTFFRYVLPEPVSEAAKAALPAEERAELNKDLASAENRATQKFETSSVRPTKSEVLTHLIVAGNVLTRFDDLEGYRMFRLDQYVCRRDAAQKPLDVVVKECIHPSALSAEAREACKVDPKSKKDVEVYTHVNWAGGQCTWRQQINDITVPDSEGHSPAEYSPWNPLRWKAVPGKDYGRGHCEEYLGDMISLEGLSQALIEGAALAAKVVFLVRPGSQTNVQDVNNAANGDAVTGNQDDIGTVGLDKYADFKFVESAVQRLEMRLSQAFLLRSGMVRDAERVTAEEVRAVAQELEDTLGGVYTVLAQEEQMPFIRRHLFLMTQRGELPRFPKGTIEPVVVTGFQALGRNHSLNKLRGAFQDLTAMFGPEGAARILKPDAAATRVFTGWGVEDLSELIKSQDEMDADAAAAQKAAMLQTLMDKGTGPMVTGALANGKQ